MKRLLGIFLFLAGSAAAPNANAYGIAAVYSIGGVGSFDYIRYDAGGQRLFVSHQTRVEVIDANTGAALGSIAGFHGVHGIALAQGLGRGFISDGPDGTVTVFDLATLAVKGSIRTGGEKPDAIEYDAKSGILAVSNGRSNTVSLIDASSGTVKKIVPVAGNPESIAFDGHGHVWVNLESANAVTQIDLAAGKVLSQWPTAPGEGPTGLALDVAGGHVIATCRSNEKMVVFDAGTGRLAAVLPIGEDSDAAGFDPRTRRAFSSNRDGTLTVVQEDRDGNFRVVQSLVTEFGAKTLALDSAGGRIFLPSAGFGPAPAGSKRRPALAGTFRILVIK